MLRKTLIPLLLLLAAVSAQAHENRTRTVVGAGLGAAVGAAIGSELGGRNEAIIGGAIGGAVGAAIATQDHRSHHQHYRYSRYDDRRYDYWEGGHRHGHGRPSFCPPGLAKQRRC